MATDTEIQKKLFEEVRTTHDAFKEAVDKQIEEVRKNGYSKSETDQKVEAISNDLTEFRKALDEITAKIQRPKGVENNASSEEEELRKSAYMKYLRKGVGESGRSIMTPDEIRSLSSTSDANGGFLVPESWESELLVKAYNDSEIRPLCNVGTTGRDSINIPSLKKPVVGWGITDVAVDTQTLTTGNERMEVFDLRALTLIHNNTLDDADANIWMELSDQFSMAVAEAEDDGFATGPGANSVKGVLADTRVLANFTITGVAADIFDSTHNGVDALISMLYGLKKTYRRNATWAMNSATEGAVRRLKNPTTDEYLWQPPVQAGAPATILGRPLINPEGYPDIAAGTYPISLGDFRKGYRIRDRSGLSIQRLSERYAEYDQTGFMIKKRVAGQVVMPEAFRVLKVSAT